MSRVGVPPPLLSMNTQTKLLSDYCMCVFQHVDTVTVKPVGVGDKLAKKAADKITSAQELKQEGNCFFKSGEWKKAIRKYHHALMYAKGVVDKFDSIPGLRHKEKATPEEESSANELIAALSNNLAGMRSRTKARWNSFTEKWSPSVKFELHGPKLDLESLQCQ